MLAAGVTTIRTAGSDFPYMDLNLKRSIDAGESPGPKIHLTGPYFNGWSGHWAGDNVVETEEEARAAVAYWAGRGVTWFKAYSDLARPALAGMIAEAHARGLRATIHPGSLSCRIAADLGVDSIEHGWGACLADIEAAGLGKAGWKERAQSPAMHVLVAHLAAKGTAQVFTPSASFQSDGVMTEEELDLLNPFVRERYLRWMLRRDHKSTTEGVAEMAALAREFQRAGGRILLGSDVGGYPALVVAGSAEHRALELMVATGFSPAETLRMATLDGARFLRVDGEVGSVARGRAADLLVVKGDPTADVRAIRNVAWVFKDGVGYDPARLRESAKGLVGWR